MGNLMFGSEGNFQQNKDGTWQASVPMPLYGLKKKCSCGKSFWKEDNYVKHFRKEHTDGIVYRRTPKGMEAIQKDNHENN